MAKFCTKEIWDALEVNGMIVVAEKPELQTSFYFGYCDMGQGLSYEENNIRTEQVKKHEDEYFTERNTEGLTKIIDNYPKYKLTEWLHLKNGFDTHCRVPKFCFNNSNVIPLVPMFTLDS